MSLSGFLQEGEEVADSGCQTLAGLCKLQCTLCWPSSQSLGPLALHSYNRLLISLCAHPFLVFHSVWSY